MDTPPQTLTIGIPIYDGVDPLDVTGPYEVFSNVSIDGKSPINVVVLAEKAGKDVAVPTRFGLKLVPQAAFDAVDHLDVLWVPGGDPRALNRLMKGGAYLDALKRWSRTARLVTSVCEGAMLLAAAGLLDGYQATTHWAFIRCFQRWPSISPVPLNPDDPGCV
jgi:putative intracellular protease/amidase